MKPLLVFDLFGTLVAEFDKTAVLLLLRRVYARCAEDPLIPAIGKGLEFHHFAEAVERMYETHYRAAARTSALSPDVLVAIHALLTEVAGEEPSIDAVEAFLTHYAESEQLVGLAEAERVLQTLRERGYEMALLSNVFFPGWIYTGRLIELGLAPWLKPMVFSADLPFMKPNIAIFNFVAQMVDRPREELVMVGDRPDLDIAGATSAGWRSVLIGDAALPGAEQATWIVPDLPSILDLFP
ncbi:MAG: HAD family hydrolase [bacterium]